MAPKLPIARVLTSCFLACGVLAGCGDTPDAEAEQAAELQGEASPVAEVLDGSVSDSMIALDELQSQPPLGSGEEAEDGDDGETQDAPE